MVLQNTIPRPLPRRIVRMLLLLAALAGATTGGCNTTEGFGKDVKATGRSIENAASDAK